MKIATLGSGNIGGTLGKLWAAKGYEVLFSSRHPFSEPMQALRTEAGERARLGTIQEAVEFGDVILLAVLPEGVEAVLKEIGDFKNKILINSTNRRDDKSAGLEVIRFASNARVVRAFHCLPWEVLANPSYDSMKASMFIAGDDPEAKAVVARLCVDINLDPVDAGDSANIPSLETAIGLLWKILSVPFGREYSLKVLRRDPSTLRCP